jgi:hypothetical protein
VQDKHENNQPFPLNGTFGNISQIARSIHSNFLKVKVALKSVLAANVYFARRDLKSKMKKKMATPTLHAGINKSVLPSSFCTCRKLTLLILLKISFILPSIFSAMVILPRFF